MANIRHLAWSAREYHADPADYGYVKDADILAREELTANQQDDLKHALTLRKDLVKQFTPKQLRELVAARGFLHVMCNWLDSDQVEDTEIRNRVALIQHLLSEIWERLG